MTSPFRSVLLGSVTANGVESGVLTGTSQPYDASQASMLTYFIKATGTISTGTLILEEADWDPLTQQIYTGTWSQIGSTIDLTALTAGPMQQAAYVAVPRAYGFVRARIGTDVTGASGAVIVVLRGLH